MIFGTRRDDVENRVIKFARCVCCCCCCCCSLDAHTRGVVAHRLRARACVCVQHVRVVWRFWYGVVIARLVCVWVRALTHTRSKKGDMWPSWVRGAWVCVCACCVAWLHRWDTLQQQQEKRLEKKSLLFDVLRVHTYYYYYHHVHNGETIATTLHTKRVTRREIQFELIRNRVVWLTFSN